MAELVNESSKQIAIRVAVGRMGAIEDPAELKAALALLLGTVVCSFGKDRINDIWKAALREAEW